MGNPPSPAWSDQVFHLQSRCTHPNRLWRQRVAVCRGQLWWYTGVRI